MVPSRKRGLAVVVAALFTKGAIAGCNVCKNGGAIINKGKAFTMKDSNTGVAYDWTCGWLEESIADVLETGGAPGESFFCGLARLWAEKECECSGDPLPPDEDNVYDPNPECDLCKTLSGRDPYDFNFVPAELAETLVNTGVAGRMPCGGLYDALSEGVLTANLCPTVQEHAGETCCSAPALDEDQIVEFKGNDPTPTCEALFGNCASRPCCDSLDCKVRVIGQDPICSTNPSKQRPTFARDGAGGAGGRAKYGN